MIEQIIKFQNQDLFINFPLVGAWAQLEKMSSNGPRKKFNTVWSETENEICEFVQISSK